jgi:hypothetical protein
MVEMVSDTALLPLGRMKQEILKRVEQWPGADDM